MTIDPLSTALGVLGAYLIWLIQWGAKHFHDAFILPRIRDWWARRNAKAALQMAEVVLEQFERNVRSASDVRYLILHVYQMLITAVLSSALFIILSFMLLFLDRHFSVGGGETIDLLVLGVVAAVYALWLFVAVKYEYKKSVAMFLNMAEHRAATVARLKTLLVAAGLNDDQIREWLCQVPSVA